MRNSIVIVLIAAFAGQAEAQERGTITLYSRSHFAGPGLPISNAATNMTPMNVKSIKVSPGTQWDLCSGNSFSGCKRFDASDASMVRTIRSVRFVAAPISQDAALPSVPSSSASGPSLRGFASEYFAAPAQSGSRVEVVGKGGEAEDRAALQFCRGRSWRNAAYTRVQSIGGRNFLADVLCADEVR